MRCLHLYSDLLNELIQNEKPVRSHSEIFSDIEDKSEETIIAKRREKLKLRIYSVYYNNMTELMKRS